MLNSKNIHSSELVLEALGKVLTSRTFSGAPQMATLLRFCVEETLAGRRQSQGRIAEALGYRDFVALADSNVRREIGRLRTKLRDYYDHEGAFDPLMISVPKPSEKDGYSADFQVRQARVEESENRRYLQLSCEARYFWAQRTPESTTEAIRLYEEAIREDPERSATAYTGLSQCYAFLALLGFPTHETMPMAKQFALRAIAADPDKAAGQAVLAFVTGTYEWNWQVAEQLFRKAIELSPYSVEVRCWYASHLVCVGRFSEATKQASMAQMLEHDPSVVVLSHVGKILYVTGNVDQAFDLLQFTEQINPHFYFSHLYLGLVLLDRGDADVALAHLRQAAELAPENPGVLAGLAYALAVEGQRSNAVAVLKRLEAMREIRYVPSTDFATVYAGLSDFKAALDALEQSFAEKCLQLTWVHAWPPYRSLRVEPRFVEMVGRVGVSGDVSAQTRYNSER